MAVLEIRAFGATERVAALQWLEAGLEAGSLSKA